MHVELVVEPSGNAVAAEGLEHERLDSAIAERLVPARECPQVLDARDLEPHRVRRVVRDSLCIRVGEAHADTSREREPFHGATIR